MSNRETLHFGARHHKGEVCQPMYPRGPIHTGALAKAGLTVFIEMFARDALAALLTRCLSKCRIRRS